MINHLMDMFYLTKLPPLDFIVKEILKLPYNFYHKLYKKLPNSLKLVLMFLEGINNFKLFF